MSQLETPEAEARAAATAAGWEPHLVAFVCKWCSSAGADMAGTTRRKYSPNVRLVRFPCTGRMNPLFILKAFSTGADGVLVSGCHPGDCHYVQGNLVARRRFTVFRSIMDFIGLDMKRLHFAWVSAAEGLKWTEVVDDLTNDVRTVGPAPRFESESAAQAFEPAQPQTPDPGGLLSPDQQAAIASNMQTLTSKLLDDGSVDTVYGYVAGSLSGRSVPGRFESSEEVAGLTWDEGCLTNLSTYLKRQTDGSKIGLVIKLCDAAGVCGLIREGQVSREDLVLIGAQCSGAGLEKCIDCTGEVSRSCDWIVTENGASPGEATTDPPSSSSFEALDGEIASLEALPPEQRWAYWQDQFVRCLRCYACRASCPLCYCDNCIAHKHRPQWIPTTIDEQGNAAWNIVRALHLAGRCSGCGECSRICPAHIRLDLLNRRVEQEVKLRFGAELPTDASVPTVFNLFKMEDPDDYIR